MFRPIVVWAGGKTKMLPELWREITPAIIQGRIEKYFEPFLGGGAFLLDLLKDSCGIRKFYAGDSCGLLIKTYRSVRDYPEVVIGCLSELADNYYAADTEGKEKIFKMCRDNLNSRISINQYDTTTAALFIFCLRLGHYSRFRLNDSGLFNTTWRGAESIRPILCEPALRSFSRMMKNVTLRECDYQKWESEIDKDSLVYLDPPYRCAPGRYQTTNNDPRKFGEKEQKELSDFVKRIDKKGAKFVLSNLDLGDGWIEKTYGKFNIRRVEQTCYLFENVDKKPKRTEFIISNID